MMYSYWRGMAYFIPYPDSWAVNHYFRNDVFFRQSFPVVEPYLMTDPYANNYYGNYYES
jgi:hypothetical protein